MLHKTFILAAALNRRPGHDVLNSQGAIHDGRNDGRDDGRDGGRCGPALQASSIVERARMLAVAIEMGEARMVRRLVALGATSMVDGKWAVVRAIESGQPGMALVVTAADSWPVNPLAEVQAALSLLNPSARALYDPVVRALGNFPAA
jgi:hypothetical protein